MVKFKSIYKTDGLGQARYDKQYGDGGGGQVLGPRKISAQQVLRQLIGSHGADPFNGRTDGQINLYKSHKGE